MLPCHVAINEILVRLSDDLAASRVECVERHCLYAVRRGGLASGIHDESASRIVREKAFDGADVVGHVVVERGTGLDFVCHHCWCKSKV